MKLPQLQLSVNKRSDETGFGRLKRSMSAADGGRRLAWDFVPVDGRCSLVTGGVDSCR